MTIVDQKLKPFGVSPRAKTHECLKAGFARAYDLPSFDKALGLIRRGTGNGNAGNGCNSNDLQGSDSLPRCLPVPELEGLPYWLISVRTGQRLARNVLMPSSTMTKASVPARIFFRPACLSITTKGETLLDHEGIQLRLQNPKALSPFGIEDADARIITFT